MTTIAKLRGEGGVVWEFGLPLSEVLADQVRTRKLVPVDDESFELIAHLLDDDAEIDLAVEPEQEQETPKDDGGGGENQKEPDAEALGTLKLVELIAYARAHGVDENTAASFEKQGTSEPKPGVSKAQVIAAIEAARA